MQPSRRRLYDVRIESVSLPISQPGSGCGFNTRRVSVFLPARIALIDSATNMIGLSSI
jgi:hypothetical protein